MHFPTIRPSKHPRYPFEVTAPARLFGQHIRRYFMTRSAAQVFLSDLQARVSRDAVSPVTREEQLLLSRYRSGLTVADMDSALSVAVTRKATASRSLTQCLEDYKTDAAQRHRDGHISALHLRDIKRHVKRLNATTLVALPLPDVTPALIQACLDGLPDLSSRSKTNLLAHLRTAFTYFRRQGWTRGDSPASLVRRPHPTRGLPSIVLPPDMVSHLDAATRLSDRRCLRWLVFSGFCGLRTSEVLRLRWEDIRWDERQLYVSPGKTKNAERWVTLTPPVLALRSLLCEPADMSSRVVPLDMKRTKARLLVASGRPLGDNALRHSFGSYHLVHYASPDTTALEMGHHSPAQTFAAYRRAVTKADAAVWWGITAESLSSPPTAGQ